MWRLCAAVSVRAGEAKKKGRGFFLQNNHAMLSAAVEQRPDLFKAQLRRLGWDV